MKILSVVGARPAFIKAAVVSKELRKKHREILVDTGQHYNDELSGIFFRELNIPKPDYNLCVGSGTHGHQTGEMLLGIEKILIKDRPDLVLVYGDTNSTLAGALAAVKLHIPIAHIEAGLRSYDRKMPEEINRIIVDRISAILFSPTQTGVNNLKEEGIKKGVYYSGDVMLDATLQSIEIAKKKSKILGKLKLKGNDYLLATIHRASNTDSKKNLENIMNAFLKIDKKIVLPVHPRTMKYFEKYGLLGKIHDSKNIILIDPVGYLDFLNLERNASKILTDSGGVQKEAYFLKIPCITLRENTEWVETVDDGWNTLVGANTGKIVEAANNFEPDREQRNVFGDGNASRKIVEMIDNH